MNWREGTFCSGTYNMDDATHHTYRNTKDEVCPAGLVASSDCDCFGGADVPLTGFAINEVSGENNIPVGWTP